MKPHPEWEESRVNTSGEKALLTRIVYQAIRDLLAKPPKISPKLPVWQQKQMWLRQSEPWWDAARWVFGDEPKEFSFSEVCRVLGADPDACRRRIVVLMVVKARVHRGGKLREIFPGLDKTTPTGAPWAKSCTCAGKETP